MTYKEYINGLKEKWIGKDYTFQGKVYKVVDIDYNGAIMINKKTQYTDTTAVEFAR